VSADPKERGAAISIIVSFGMAFLIMETLG